ncbi:ribosomal-protein-serine acetyltransferase [Candidatus Scalindua japonica]|uniref:Ribosomal-protein-serine acetyltransferase n=1 Tax=Candidatus Scalindua japonica TaxID=1284222 RepID=A0A286U1B8_9BACT|nr:GNAT family protein [Candidatus Scalindua japonica]GAX61912.1 ribosomal-protein-serine acetyltransferase [Candidatus Scalindua japonica]
MENKIKLTDGNIFIRPCQPEDAAVICEGVQETMGEMLKWAPWCHPEYSISDCKSWLDSRQEMWTEGVEYDFAIFSAKENTFFGGCAIDQINRKHNFANLGYWTRASQVGNGIATSAVKLISQFGFETLGFTRLEIVAAVRNKASQRIAEKVGAVREGIHRNRHVVRDKIYDSVMFSLIPKNCQAPI